MASQDKRARESEGSEKPKKSKRGRIGHSCFDCRRRKIRCDNQSPCDQCIARGDADTCRGATNVPAQTGHAAVSFLALAKDDELAAKFAPARFDTVFRLSQKVTLLETQLAALIKGKGKGLYGTEAPQEGLGSSLLGAETSEGGLKALGDASDGSPLQDLAWLVSANDPLVGETGRNSSAEQLDENAIASLEEATLMTELPKWPEAADTTSPSDRTVRTLLQQLVDGQTNRHVDNHGWPSIYLPVKTAETPLNDIFRALSGFQGSGQSLQAGLLALLPPASTITTLLQHFKNEASPYWNVLHRPTFDTEVGQVLAHLLEQERNASRTTDPTHLFSYLAQHSGTSSNGHTALRPVNLSWLAILFAALALSAGHVGNAILRQLRWEEADGQRMKQKWLAASQMAMLDAINGQPTVRDMQAALLICANLPHTASPFGWQGLYNGVDGRLNATEGKEPPTFRYWLSVAINQARYLGLDKVGHPSFVIPEDAAWPEGDNCIKTQLACRLWHTVVFLDRKTCPDGGSLSILQGSYTTPLPLRCTDESLLPNLAHPRYLCQPQEVSDGDFVLYQRVLSDHLVLLGQALSKSSVLTYEVVMELDSKLRIAVSTYVGTAVGEVPVVNGKLERSFLKKAVAASLHNRLLRLHRPGFVRGLQRPCPAAVDGDLGSRDLSTRTCLECARVIVILYADEVEGLMSWWWAVVHLFGAAVILALDRLHLLQHHKLVETHPQTYADKVAQDLALKTLERVAEAGGRSSNSALRCAQVLKNLRGAETPLAAATAGSKGKSESLQSIFGRLKGGTEQADAAVPPSGETFDELFNWDSSFLGDGWPLDSAESMQTFWGSLSTSQHDRSLLHVPSRPQTPWHLDFM